MNSALATVCTVVALSVPLEAAVGSESSEVSIDLVEGVRAQSLMRESHSPIPESLKATVQLQMRYNFNKRGSQSTTLAAPDDDLTIGFTNRRSILGLSGQVTDDISAKMTMAFSQSTGMGSLEFAMMNWKLSDNVNLRAGQFKPMLVREENMSSSRQLTVDRSAVNETFNQDFTQGIELQIFEDNWRAMFGFNDGFSTHNTYITSASEGDVGFTARGEFRFGDASWKQYKQFTSWRGANGGLMVGAGIHHQTMGNTNPSTTPSTDMSTGTIDASLLGDGWTLFAAGTWQANDTGTSTITDAGFVFQGGVFVTDNDEFFGRWDMVMPSESNPIVVGTSGNKEFHTITLGWNRYLVQESHAAKFTLQIQRYLDPTTESIVAIRGNLLPDSTGDQFSITAQFQLLF